ncbi:hypothetical protein XENTR_v10010600 [Xenopus tropicalis]|nr:hypothetical protein XENTR_v10010600 [Xenopus tropicalis]
MCRGRLNPLYNECYIYIYIYIYLSHTQMILLRIKPIQTKGGGCGAAVGPGNTHPQAADPAFLRFESPGANSAARKSTFQFPTAACAERGANQGRATHPSGPIREREGVARQEGVGRAAVGVWHYGNTWGDRGQLSVGWDFSGMVCGTEAPDGGQFSEWLYRCL